jgi:hypothetical protein
MSKTVLQKHYVEFISPGTFFPETTLKEVDSWDVKKAEKMARKINERYNSKPYGFRFVTRGRGEKDLDSKVIKTSPTYYIDAIEISAAEILAGTRKDETILRDNVRINDIKRLVTNGPNSKTYKFFLPLQDGDVVLS